MKIFLVIEKSMEHKKNYKFKEMGQSPSIIFDRDDIIKKYRHRSQRGP